MNDDLISRKALLKKLDECEKLVRKLTANVDDEAEMIVTLSAVRKFVNNRPAVDAEPVRHARWLDDDRYFGYGERCSACASGSTGHGRNKYCPNCGARMDGGGD